MVSGLPPLLPWISSFLYLAVALAHLYYSWVGLCSGDESPGRTGALIALLSLLIGLELYVARSRMVLVDRRALVVLLAARVVLFEVVATLECAGFSKFLYLLVPFQAYFCLGRLASYGLGLLYVSLLVARFSSHEPLWYVQDAYVSVLLIFAVGVAFAIFMARALRDEEASRARAERLLADLDRSHQELRAYSERVAELAAAEERNRLARDVHDSLGHYLTAINVQLEKAIAFRQQGPEEADRAVRDAKGSAMAALVDVRQSVAALRSSGESFSLRTALSDLVARMENGRFTIDLHVEGDEAGFQQLALMSLYRAAQEGLTNVYRHAHASEVVVRVDLNQGGANLSLSDNGRGFDPAMLEHLSSNRRERFGLQGLRERVELVGGRMEVEGSPERGTRLFVRIPRPALGARDGR